MLEQIDLDRSISKQEYRERRADLSDRLQNAMQGVLDSRLPVAVVLEGWAGTAKVRTIGVITRRLDPRGLRVHPIAPPRTFEKQFPWLHRFWRLIPSYGRLVLFDRSWYREVLAARTRYGMTPQEFRERCEDMVAFERQLVDDGAVILKFWMHISRKEQGRRFRKLLGDRLTAWQVTDEDRWQHRNYDKVADAVEDVIARTSTPAAPWIAVPATDARYARITVMEALVTALERRLGLLPAPTSSDDDDDDHFDNIGGAYRRAKSESMPPERSAPPSRVNGHANAPAPEVAVAPALSPLAFPSILRNVDLNLRIDEKEYSHTLAELQAHMHLLGFQVYQQQRPVILVFEGWDAAGKGGAIQRITEELDPRSYVVHAIAAPAGDDKARHYLYRFWRRLPPRGQICIFDRSWYGRVLVERVEGFARTDEWQRAYAEINEFERQLVDFGTIICKFWLHISPEEQLRRFQERQSVPYKAWKLTDEDWRNREKWPQYEEAADEMLLRTSTPYAPWTIVESEDKRFARIKTLRTVVRRLEADLGKVHL
jgi:polyphosphate kinase 2 (PPK2 family)